MHYNACNLKFCHNFFSALFEYVPGKVAKKEDDSIVFNVMVPMQCANYCVNPTEKDFVCNSYDFCSNVVGNDFTYECRLSRSHTSDGIILSNSSTCDHFSSKFMKG